MKYAYLLLAGLAASGCANNDLSLTITRFAALTTTSMCVADATTMNSQTAGLLDVGIVKAGQSSGIEGYVAAPVVTNNLPERVGAGQIELDAITVDAFQISLQLDSTLQGVVPINQRIFTQNAAVGTIPPGGTSMFAADVEILPAQIAAEMASAVQPGATFLPTVVASVQPLGWHGGAAQRRFKGRIDRHLFRVEQARERREPRVLAH